MVSKRIRRLAVIKDNKLVGIITTTDFVRYLGKKTISDGILEAMGRSYYPIPEVFEK
jgi:CBS domain-containing protein